MIILQRELWVIQVSFYYKQILVVAFNIKTDETKVRMYKNDTGVVKFIDSLTDKLIE